MAPTAAAVVQAEAFYHSLDVRRRKLRLSWRKVCEQAGISNNSVITRLGRGQKVMSDSLLSLSAWLRETKADPAPIKSAAAGPLPNKAPHP
jgi:hypothetical protein